MQRRAFLRDGALALVTLGLSPTFLRRTALASGLTSAASRGRTLICLFQRGAADALNVVVPHGERAYYALRPNIAIAPPGRPKGAIELDEFFGLHPALAPLQPLWRAGMLAPVHAVGSPSATRSHFDAQDYMETASAVEPRTRRRFRAPPIRSGTSLRMAPSIHARRSDSGCGRSPSSSRRTSASRSRSPMWAAGTRT